MNHVSCRCLLCITLVAPLGGWLKTARPTLDVLTQRGWLSGEINLSDRGLTTLLTIAGYGLVLLLGVGIAFYPTLLSQFALMQGNPGDPRLCNYFLEHSFRFLFQSDYGATPWSPSFFYPYPHVLAFSETLWGVAPLYWLFRVWVSPELAFQLWLIGVSSLNFGTMAFLLRSWQIRPSISALGGFLFAFGLARIAQIEHPQLLCQFYTPLVFWAVWRWGQQPGLLGLVAILLGIYLQWLASIYLGWFLLMSLPIALFLLYATNAEWRDRGRHFFSLNGWAKAWQSLAIGLAFGGLGVWTFWPYLEAKSVLGDRPYSIIDELLPRPSSWLSVDPGHWWSRWLGWASQDLPAPWEHHLFPGVMVIGLAIAVLAIGLLSGRSWPVERQQLVVTGFTLFLILFVLSLRWPNGFSFWLGIYQWVPGGSVIRGVSRIWTIADFYLLIAICAGVDCGLSSLANYPRRQWAIAVLLCLLSFGEQFTANLPAYAKAALAGEVEAIGELLRPDCRVAYLQIDPRRFFYIDQLSAMWAGLRANIPVVNGYSGNVPPTYYGAALRSMDIPEVMEWLNTEGFTLKGKLCWVVHASADGAQLAEALRDPLTQELPLRSVSSTGGFVAYEIPIVLRKVAQQLEALQLPTAVTIRQPILLPLALRNASNFMWSPVSLHPTTLAYRWLDDQDGKTLLEEHSLSLPSYLLPGEETLMEAAIKVPPKPGHYQLVLSLFQKGYGWFDQNHDDHLILHLDVASE